MAGDVRDSTGMKILEALYLAKEVTFWQSVGLGL